MKEKNNRIKVLRWEKNLREDWKGCKLNCYVLRHEGIGVGWVGDKQDIKDCENRNSFLLNFNVDSETQTLRGWTRVVTLS
jgi:hypothetical protein